jgi:hypothetical protein
MATTNLIVDFLVIGLIALIWISPVAVLTLETKWIDNILNIGVTGLPFVLGLSYILGISVSRLADDLTSRWDDKWKDEVFGKDAVPSYHSQLNLVIAKSESASEYLSYRRSVIRTARACGVNFAIGAMLWIVLAIVKADVIPAYVSIFVATFSLLLSVWLFRAWSTVLKGYFHGIKDLYGYLHEETQSGSGDTDG